jgi:cytochrome b6-f complex iron-sulfur subunit
LPDSDRAGGEVARDRRRLLGWLLGGGFISSLASFLYPAIRYLNPPPVAEASVNEVVAAKVQGFALNSGQVVRFGTQPVLLVRLSETDWRAFSAVCTHLGCIVQYEAARHAIWCACHNGLYDLNGKVISGPPPRPLHEYAVHIRAGDVIVSRT